MEDRIYLNSSEPARIGKRNIPQHKFPLALLAVFDGHGGDYVAAALQRMLGSTFSKFLADHMEVLDFNDYEQLTTDGAYEGCIAQVFQDTCALMDSDILEKDYARQQKNIHNGIQDFQTFAGSVAIMMAILPAVRVDPMDATKQGVEIFIAHVGDCRAVMSRDGDAVQLTQDHKANNKSEKARIEAAGGWVHNGRVNGALGVSRSFGDIQFKCLQGEEEQIKLGVEYKDKIWSQQQQVISKPDFNYYFIESTCEFVIMASDGLWDVFPCQEAVNFVRKQLTVHKDLDLAAKELINKAIARGTQDNTSVVICAFNQK